MYISFFQAQGFVWENTRMFMETHTAYQQWTELLIVLSALETQVKILHLQQPAGAMFPITPELLEGFKTVTKAMDEILELRHIKVVPVE